MPIEKNWLRLLGQDAHKKKRERSISKVKFLRMNVTTLTLRYWFELAVGIRIEFAKLQWEDFGAWTGDDLESKTDEDFKIILYLPVYCVLEPYVCVLLLV